MHDQNIQFADSSSVRHSKSVRDYRISWVSRNKCAELPDPSNLSVSVFAMIKAHSSRRERSCHASQETNCECEPVMSCITRKRLNTPAPLCSNTGPRATNKSVLDSYHNLAERTFVEAIVGRQGITEGKHTVNDRPQLEFLKGASHILKRPTWTG